MGFKSNGLGPKDQKLLRELETKIINTLRNAASQCRGPSGACRQAKTRWFGQVSELERVEEQWIRTTLQRKLQRMRTVLNLNPVTVMAKDYGDRDREMYGWAFSREIANVTEAFRLRQAQAQDRDQDQHFSILLDSGWWGYVNAKYPSPPPSFTLNKFHAVVHELTHMILGTVDHVPPYGPQDCKRKAENLPGNARENADNWAFFVDEMYHAPPIVRTSTDRGELPSYTDWMRDTEYGGNLRRRGPKLRKVDKALEEIQRGVSQLRRDTLKRVFNEWYHDRTDRQRRNKNDIVEKLHRYIENC